MADSSLEKKFVETPEWKIRPGFFQSFIRAFVLSPLKWRRRKLHLWILAQRPTSSERKRLAALVETLPYKPLISIVVPTYNTDPQLLRECVGSVVGQIYPHWELCIADDASPKANTQKALDEVGKLDKRIKVVRRSENGHISRATNSALDIATGEFVGFLDHDDTIEPHALFEYVKVLNQRQDVDLIYCDEDKIGTRGLYESPTCKPDWSPDFLYSHNHICHFSVYRRSLVEDVGRLRPGYDGSQDYDLVLRASEKARGIVRVPKVLYHWRKIPGSAAMNFEQKIYAYLAARRALTDALERNDEEGDVAYRMGLGAYMVRRKIVRSGSVGIVMGVPKGAWESAIVATPNLICSSIPVKTIAYSAEEDMPSRVTTIDSGREATVKNVQRLTIKRKEGAIGPGFNEAARALDTDYIVCMRLPIIADEESRWLEPLLAHAQRKEIGVVAARLIHPKNRIWECGVVIQPDGTPWYPMRGTEKAKYGYLGLSQVVRNCLAVSWDMMVVRREVFEELKGFDENAFAGVYGDLDLCLRARESGYRVIINPDCDMRYLIYTDPIVSADAKKAFASKWKNTIAEDPYFSRNLKLRHGDAGDPTPSFYLD